MSIQAIKDTTKYTSQKFLNHAKNLYNISRDKKIRFISLAVIIALVIGIYFWIYRTIHLKQSNCKVLSKVYNSTPTLASIPSNSPYLVRDFYIKTAYNCCATGQFKNDFVGLCALRTCIQQGVRCLDFEIYSINNTPVVAVSSINDFSVKESFNSIPMADVFNLILNMGFSNQHCPNPNDPLILHFRLMSKNVPMYTNLANQISSLLNSRVLGVNYSFETGGKNFGAFPITNFLGKIIIFADATNPIYQKTKLDEYINAATGTPFFRSLQFQEVKFTQDLTFKDFNKKNMSIVMPDWSANDKNPNFNIARQYGCQMIGMSFQNFDSNLEHYNAFFDGNKTAFVLKPKELRFVPVTVDVPPASPPNYSFQARAVTNDYYNYRI